MSKKEDLENEKIKFDLSWKWFDFHAKQRQSNIQFSLTLITGLFAVCGYLINSDNFVISSILCILGTVGCIIFYGLDRRNSYLTKLGESGIRAFENVIFVIPEIEDGRILSRADDDQKFHVKYSTAAKIIYFSSSVSFLLIFSYCVFQLRPEIKLAYAAVVSHASQTSTNSPCSLHSPPLSQKGH
jgi:hypothetical protein